MSTLVNEPEGGSRLAERVSDAALAVYIALFVIFLLAPIVIVVMTSFTPGETVAVSLDGMSLRWYRRFLEYRPFTDSLITSLMIAALATVFAILFAVPAALGIATSRSRLANAVTSFLLSPIAVPPLVVGLSSLYYLSELGIGNSFVALLITHTCVSVPYVLRTTIAACRNLDPRFGEAASVLGASAWQRFAHVTLPLISPGVFAGALFSVLISLDNLGVSYFFGSATTTTLPVVMLSYLQNQFDPSIAAISTVQMLIAIVLLVVVEKIYGLRAINN
ncbi:ABC-type spermidine/putrescine transport system, permease component II [Burkholderia sp. Ch1-1]|uniref:ABC-type spermidine/putrescine transport system, permease component II n=1 Tax=Paraburkholderia dioscoreae TaxID=2604047 RepID=A0A5Q4ZQT1_9BURK|nr:MULTISPECIES: ABC transporter permease [Paraburkholderia]EIF34476.1 ABC-type spermidine/putrescine transport system, permease component II [Burkholderia sp. Ch1-1]MDR8395342.1 ABC transporter permease [Paraburkholderia sp. USG1]VVD33418.1 ABC-type spermidine/putrescine transport system, permease component II [Paraburkholderia dioscoreae]